MIAKTNKQKVAESEGRKKAKGLIKRCYWIYPEDGPVMLKKAAALRTKRDSAR